MVKQVRKGKVNRRRLTRGLIHIHASFHNTIINATDPKGNVVAWSSAGSCGFKGAKRGTPFAAQQAAQNVVRRCAEIGIQQVEVIVRGPGAGRDTAIRALQAGGIGIILLRDTTPIPHNGCRAPKRRRI